MSDSLAKTSTKALIVLTQDERDRLRRQYRRASDRNRTSMVAHWLLQGVSAEKMSEMIGVPVEDIKAQYEQAVEEVREEMEEIPEGPFLMSQIVAEGTSRAAMATLKKIDALLDKLMNAPELNHSQIQAYLKLRLDTMEKVADRMERLGFVPNFNKIHSSHGGARPGINKSSGGDVLANLLSSLNEDERASIRDGAVNVIENSVE